MINTMITELYVCLLLNCCKFTNYTVNTVIYLQYLVQNINCRITKEDWNVSNFKIS